MSYDAYAVLDAPSDARRAINVAFRTIHLNDSYGLSDLLPPSVSSAPESPTTESVPLVTDGSATATRTLRGRSHLRECTATRCHPEFTFAT